MLDLVLDLNYFYFSKPNPNPKHLPKHQTLSPNHKFSQRIWNVEYYSVHAHMAWSQKFCLTPVSRVVMVAFRDVLSRAQSIKCNGAKPGVLLPGLFFSCLSRFLFLKSVFLGYGMKFYL